MDIMNFLMDNSIVLVPALYVVGTIAKDTEKIKDKYIPLALLPFGVIGSVGLNGFNIQSIIQGILVTGAAVYTNQLFKQKEKEE